jgi:hypothetical protein
MATVTIAVNRERSLVVSRHRGEVMVFSFDKQFRNSYGNIVGGGQRFLYGVGEGVDGRFVDISRGITDFELAWLASDDIEFLVSRMAGG